MHHQTNNVLFFWLQNTKSRYKEQKGRTSESAAATKVCGDVFIVYIWIPIHNTLIKKIK
jgi:hypothetical protein